MKNLTKKEKVEQKLLRDNLFALDPLIKIDYMIKTKNKFNQKEYDLFTAKWMMSTAEYWRQIKNGYKKITPEFLRKIEKFHGMDPNSLDVKNEFQLNSSKHAFDCMRLVKKYIKENNIVIDDYEKECAMIENIYNESLQSGMLSEKSIIRYIKML